MNNSSELFDHQRFLVFGAARSGLAAAKLLKGMGKDVVLFDEAPPEKLADARKQADAIGVPLHSDVDEIGFPDGWEVLVLSPGIPTTHPMVVLAEECGCIVRSEIEIGYLASPVPLIAVTGTNGKTTVTHLAAHLFNTAGRPAVMGGNVGRPLSDAVLDPRLQSPQAAIVCEVSSYQLETIEHFVPQVACVLNITPDHLDRYVTMANYVEAKYQITENQDESHALVLNNDDHYCMSLLPRTLARGWLFSLRHPVDRGAFLKDGDLYLAAGGDAAPLRVMSRGEIPLPGLHNTANVLAALCMGAAMGLDPAGMAEAVRTFQVVPHRIEPVGELDGVRYYNDSKATNLDSMQKALESFGEPESVDPENSQDPSSETAKEAGAGPRIVLIAGGRDKGAPWDRLNDLVAKTVKGLVTIGEAAPLAREAWGGIVENVQDASDMADAVQRARAMARPGDVVLLSPGCASFDMYENFERRGDHFRDIVRNMTGTKKN